MADLTGVVIPGPDEPAFYTKAGGGVMHDTFAKPAGAGWLAGTFPAGTTTVQGVPVSATVRALLRKPGHRWDGQPVGEVQSAPDGTWRISGLDPTLRYDVVGRYNGYNDVIQANVAPEVD